MPTLTHYELRRLIDLLDKDVTDCRHAQQALSGGLARLAGMRYESSQQLRDKLAEVISKDVKRIGIVK